MEHCKVKNMYDLTQTLAAPLLETVDYPWEALPKIGEFIKEIGPSLTRKFLNGVEKISGLQNRYPLQQQLH